MDRGEIAGFWYDEAKRKYFRIVPGHVAPEGAGYERGAVRRGREREEEKNEAARLRDLQKRTCIRRAKLLDCSYGPALPLSRETGRYTGSSSSLSGRVLAQRLEVNKTLSFDSPPRSECKRITSFVRDEATGNLFAGLVHQDLSSCVRSWAVGDGRDKKKKSYQQDAVRDVSWHVKTEVTSLSLMNPAILLSTTLGGPEGGGSMQLHRLYDPESDAHYWPFVDRGIQTDFQLGGHNPATIWGHSANSVRCCAPDIALATSAGIGSYDLQWNEMKTLDRGDHHSDVLAVKWLTPWLLAGGCRNGSIDLHDFREQKKVRKLIHPSAVTSIRAIDESRMVVAGMNHQLHTYDLRYCSLSTSTKSELGGNENVDRRESTLPYMSYPSYRNSASWNLGFDVSPSLRLIAAATEECTVKLLDIWTGREVPSGWGEAKVWDDTVRCLSFTGMDKFGVGTDDKADQGLMVVNGTTVAEWGC